MEKVPDDLVKKTRCHSFYLVNMVHDGGGRSFQWDVENRLLAVVYNEDGSALKKGFSREETQRVLEEGGRLPSMAYLRCRVRYFTDGAVIGSRSFVNDIFKSTRERFGEKRKTGVRLMKGLNKEEKLYALRDLRADVLG